MSSSNTADESDQCQGPPLVWCGKAASQVKVFAIDRESFSDDIFAAATGPDVGVRYVDRIDDGDENKNHLPGKQLSLSPSLPPSKK